MKKRIAAERIDDLMRNGFRIIQRPDRFCFGTDAVLLSWFAAAGAGDRVLDLCSGHGIVPMLMEARRNQRDVRYTGIEIQEEETELAKRSAKLNGTGSIMTFLTGDLKQAAEFFPKQSFDVVTCNPPYIRQGAGIVNPDDAKAVSRHEIRCSLEDVLRAASDMLKPSGKLFMVHRPNRFPEIPGLLRKGHIGISRVRFVHPYADREASLVLIEGIKNTQAETHIEPPLILYEADGGYTEALKGIYGSGQMPKGL